MLKAKGRPTFVLCVDGDVPIGTKVLRKHTQILIPARPLKKGQGQRLRH